MDLRELKLQNLGIDSEKFKKILTIVDFGNVTYWYHKDRIGPDAAPLKENQHLVIDLEKLHDFIKGFSFQARFYYGWHPRLSRSQHIVVKADKVGFVKNTKRIQYIKHYLSGEEHVTNSARIFIDGDGEKYIEIPKCNFDVEITLDAVRLMDDYDTLCLFSGDSDFARLAHYAKKKGKEIIVVASGRVYYELKKSADLYINAQKIKSDVVSVTETTPPKGRGLDFGSAAGGQGGFILKK